jgi:hypothetical protein
LLIEALPEHIQIPGEAETAANASDATRLGGLRQAKGGSELLEDDAQSPEADPHLVEGFRIVIGEHVGLQSHETPQPRRNQIGGERTTRTAQQGGGPGIKQGGHADESAAFNTNLIRPWHRSR